MNLNKEIKKYTNDISKTKLSEPKKIATLSGKIIISLGYRYSPLAIYTLSFMAILGWVISITINFLPVTKINSTAIVTSLSWILWYAAFGMISLIFIHFEIRN